MYAVPVGGASSRGREVCTRLRATEIERFLDYEGQYKNRSIFGLSMIKDVVCSEGGQDLHENEVPQPSVRGNLVTDDREPEMDLGSLTEVGTKSVSLLPLVRLPVSWRRVRRVWCVKARDRN